MVEISENELKEVLHSFHKDKSPGPDGCPIEFCLGFYDLIGGDLLRMVKESREVGHIHAPLNSTFNALISKSDNPTSFQEFRLISLCNCLYKIVSKIIARHIKIVLSRRISYEQFGFLEGRQIHEAIGVAQEALHSMKTRNLKSVVIKIDLSKAYNHVNWLYIKMFLAHLGFHYNYIRWIMSCIYLVSFAILITAQPQIYFSQKGGLVNGVLCLLYYSF